MLTPTAKLDPDQSFHTDDHTSNMTALGALAAPKPHGGNVIRLRG